MLNAMAYTTFKLHKSEYEADYITFRAVLCRAKWVKPDTAMAAVAVPVSVTVWITSRTASRLAAS